jgi:hypothetical protein
VRSRSQIVEIEHTGVTNDTSTLDVAKFLSAPPVRRIEMLKTILQKDDDDKYNTGAILAFLAALERQAAHVKDAAKMHEALGAIYRARMYMTDRGALVKTLLESVALLAPMV